MRSGDGGLVGFDEGGEVGDRVGGEVGLLVGFDDWGIFGELIFRAVVSAGEGPDFSVVGLDARGTPGFVVDMEVSLSDSSISPLSCS